MPAFNITRRVNYRYMRELGVHHDLSAADCENLAKGGFGHVVEGQEAVTPEPVALTSAPVGETEAAPDETSDPAGEPNDEASTSPAEVTDAGEGSNDPAVGADASTKVDVVEIDPLVCEVCSKGPFKTAAAIANHRRSHA